MKKIISICLFAFIYTGILFAQSLSTVSGVWERGKPKVVKMFKVINGNLSEVATSEVKEDGTFNMSFTPEYEGYYALGTSAGRMTDRYVFYFKPGDALKVQVMRENYQLLGKENTAENKEMARWHDFLFPLEDKAVYFQGKNSTYVDFFPLLEEKLKELKAFKSKKTKNKVFDTSFTDYRDYSLLQTALQFVYSVRSAHPQDEDFIDFYRNVDVAKLTRSASVLAYPDALRTIMNAFMNHLRFVSTGLSENERRKQMENFSWTVLKQNGGVIANDTIKGELALMFGHNNRTIEGMEEYGKEYGDFFITEDQRQRWKHLKENFKKDMEKKLPIDFTFPDIEGTNVSLSDFRGKVVYIDIWATWCGPCKKELPYLKALETEYNDNKDIVFMGVSVDVSKSIQKWKDFIKENQLPGVQLFGGDLAGPALSKPYKITGIPRFMLVGRDGNLIYVDAPRPSSTEIRAVLNDALKK